MRHILFELPTPWLSIPIMGYGLMIVLGFISGILLAHWRARRCGENPEHVMNLGLLSLVGGVVGARLLYVYEHSGEFSPAFASQGLLGGLFAIVNVRAGGLDFYGGVLLAIAFAVVYIVAKKLSTRRMLDIVAPSLMLGLAFGRAGCFLNGCCWGGRCQFGTDEAPIAAGEILSKDEVARRQAGKAAEELLTIKFPFASPAYDQQAAELPWQIINRDNQVAGWIVPHPSEDGPTLHVAAPAKQDTKWPWVRVPVDLLRPKPVARGVDFGWLKAFLPPDLQAYLDTLPRDPAGEPAVAPLEIARQSWKILDPASGKTHYYLAVEASRDQLKFRHEPVNYRPADPVLELPAGSVVFDPTADTWAVNFSYLSRDEVLSSATDAQRQAAAMVQSLPVYPAQIYGLVNALLLCLILTIFFPRRRREGQVFALMLVLYPMTRYLLEGVRRDTPPTWLGFMTFSQMLSLFCFIGAVGLWMYIFWLPEVAAVPSSGILPQPNHRGDWPNE
jgi:prolipoprotein diacylglyceryltransferase